MLKHIKYVNLGKICVFVPLWLREKSKSTIHPYFKKQSQFPKWPNDYKAL
jgi:hypothetical protein